MSDITTLRGNRPTITQKQGFQATPKYTKHKAEEDQLAILVCQIKIWKPKGTDWFNIPAAKSCTTIRECESIEVSDSAKELVNKAVVRFPRGTVIKLRSDQEKEVKVGNKDQSTDATQTQKEATNGGEVITYRGSKYKEDNVSITSIAPNYDDKGLVDFNSTPNEPALLSPDDVTTGNRIEIRLGYAYSDTEFKEMNEADHTDNSKGMDMVFTGFITSVSVNTPLELECTNMAHVLTSISTPNISAKATVSVKDFLDDNGKWHLLKDTGITLAECSKNLDIQVSGGAISNNLTVADVLTEWGKSGVLCVMENKQDGSVQLRVGLTYYAGTGGGDLPNNDKKYITYTGGDNTVTLIQFDWDVAQDKLNLMRNDKKYLAVEASGRTSDNQFFKLTIRKEPDTEDEGWMVNYDGQWDVVNERKLKPKKEQKHAHGTLSDKKIDGHLTHKVDLKSQNYNVIHYFSTKVGVTRDELIAEAKQYWASYNPNGISGSIIIFGDLLVKPTDIVGLVDMRQPEKNGYYYVESVNTTFGLDGYRRELKMPYKIASFKGQVEFID